MRRHVDVAVRLLSSRLTEQWTLRALAEEVHLSASQLVRAFDAVVGLSPMAYLRHLRVQQMARLLSSTDLPIRDLAPTVGWPDANHASRRFRSHYGISPTRYRQEQTGSALNLKLNDVGHMPHREQAIPEASVDADPGAR